MFAMSLQRGRADYCHYIFHHGARVCPHEDQDRLLQHFLDRASSGSQWATNMLQLTPCDLWPFIHGRTVWLMGDSITQVLAHIAQRVILQPNRAVDMHRPMHPHRPSACSGESEVRGCTINGLRVMLDLLWLLRDIRQAH